MRSELSDDGMAESIFEDGGAKHEERFSLWPIETQISTLKSRNFCSNKLGQAHISAQPYFVFSEGNVYTHFPKNVATFLVVSLFSEFPVSLKSPNFPEVPIPRMIDKISASPNNVLVFITRTSRFPEYCLK
uniref:Uncharacterized protein n=1 Tax=Romanomermis culicivorax TaxID=13658 RepID=A0A915KS67_ROMCU